MADVKPKGKPRGKGFEKGDPRIAPLQRAAEAGASEKPEPPPRVEVEGSGLLADYRFVWENDKAHDDTPKRKTLRKLLNDDPRGFVKDLKELEKADLAAGAAKAPAADGVPPTPAAAPDLGTDKALALVDRLLAEIGVKP